MSSSQSSKKPKAPNACQRCRARKVRCSGQQPCDFCMGKNLQCILVERERTVTVPRSLIDGLKSRISALESGRSPSPSVSSPAPLQFGGTSRPFGEARFGPDTPPRTVDVAARGQEDARNIAYIGEDVANEAMPNSLTSYAFSIMVSEHGQYRCVGHSSNWSLNQRLRAIIGSSLGDASAVSEVPTTDGKTYKIPWKQKINDLSDVKLPSLEYAEYLANSASFHLGALYYLFDKDIFIHDLKLFYANRISEMQHGMALELWKVQMLMIFAFGEALLTRESSPSGPAGSHFFLHALDLLPNIHGLYFQPILAIQVLCLLSLFAQASDMKSTSYGYIGMAIRIAITQGLNCEVSHLPNPGGATFGTQDFRLWWTVYSIDRRLAAIMGLMLMPMTCDGMTSQLNSAPDSIIPGSELAALKLHVVLSSNLGKVLNVVYGLEGKLGWKFIGGVQSVLSELSRTSKLLNDCFPIDTAYFDSANYRVAASLHLLGHQCAMLAIRPVVFFIVEKKLASGHSLALSDAVKALLRVGRESACNSLKILEILKSRHLLDILFLFDLDSILSAAVLLIMLDIIDSSRSEYQWALQESVQLFEAIHARGNVPASHYKKTLMDLVEVQNKIRREAGNGAADSTAAASELGGNYQAHEPRIETSSTAAHIMFSYNEQDHSDPYCLNPDILQNTLDGLDFGVAIGTQPPDIEDGWLWEDSVANN